MGARKSKKAWKDAYTTTFNLKSKMPRIDARECEAHTCIKFGGLGLGSGGPAFRFVVG